MRPRRGSNCLPQRGSAMAEALVALLALSPFLIGVPLLGKQLDIKHKAFDATRYALWERTVWRNEGASHRKSAEDITLEARDRVLGDPKAFVMDVEALRAEGITENRFWVDRQRQRLIDYERNPNGMTQEIGAGAAPVDVGYVLVPGLTYGDGPVGTVGGTLRVSDLDLNRRAFARTRTRIDVRPSLAHLAASPPSLGHEAIRGGQPAPLFHEAAGGILSDTWAAGAESEFRNRIDYVTANEFIELLEMPARAIGALALGRGRPLYGEGQFAWEPELRPSSTDLPRAYIGRR
ncbi:MAG: hypothetical protein GX535_03440 [Xanthomonadaceae bacterium]|nr:hypothetical protein [Xanthomonadaceae bacterium]